ncbi:putative short-chain dehydrogenase/reductase [Hypoxylon sp. FL1150]|nr:putative short-chain dehydrogenase/reductase [Hypoxylon sp. FL1150]
MPSQTNPSLSSTSICARRHENELLLRGASLGGLGFELVKAFEAPAKIFASSVGTDIESVASCLKHVQKRTGDQLGVLAFAPLLVVGPERHRQHLLAGRGGPDGWQGACNSSKAAKTSISETLCIELEPVGVRVLTAIVGEMPTRIYSHVDSEDGFSPSLPDGSRYKLTENFVQAQGRGQLQLNNEDYRIMAQNLVNDTLRGKRGKTWHGGVAGYASVAT